MPFKRSLGEHVMGNRWTWDEQPLLTRRSTSAQTNGCNLGNALLSCNKLYRLKHHSDFLARSEQLGFDGTLRSIQFLRNLCGAGYSWFLLLHFNFENATGGNVKEVISGGNIVGTLMNITPKWKVSFDRLWSLFHPMAKPVSLTDEASFIFM